MPKCARGTDTVTNVAPHACQAITTIDNLVTVGTSKKVYVNGLGVACLGDVTVSHTILIGDTCVSHVAPIHAGSGNVFINGIPVARLEDAADLGTITTGSSNVFINGE